MSSKTLIIIGETGSGKTTQIPQIIHESVKQEFGIIAITQPRRVAAITISKRVALEQKCSIGETVGYVLINFQYPYNNPNLLFPLYEDIRSASRIALHTKLKSNT